MRFRFDGKAYVGLAGDTLASALIANGVDIVGRSFKYHRPRGIFAAGAEEPNALVQLGTSAWSEPNLKATQIELFDGLEARSVNAWPSAGFDLRAVNNAFSALLPAGFYYKTFMWPKWRLFEGPIRRAAGLGTAPTEPDPDTYQHAHAHCDVLVVGSGASGIAAAYHAAQAGARVFILEQERELGGGLVALPVMSEEEAGAALAREMLARLPELGVTILVRTNAFGVYDHNLVAAVEMLANSEAGRAATIRQRLWKIRAKSIVLATGAHERPLVFSNNDRPGVMLASAAAQYAWRFAASPGKRAVIAACDDTAYRAARTLRDCGVDVAAIVDGRPDGGVTAAAELGIPVIHGRISNASGTRRVRGVTIDEANGDRRRLECDLVCSAGGWSPAVHLFSQAGGRLRFCSNRLMFVPDDGPSHVHVVGAANGSLQLASAIEGGERIGSSWRTAARSSLQSSSHGAGSLQLQTAPSWVPQHGQKAFVDLANDVTASDVALAAQENYRSVEHLKRYTTLGMAPDQGKTSNVNGLGLMGVLTGRAPDEVGTTRFRPPYSPVTLGALAGPYRGDLYRPRRYLAAHKWHRERGALFEEMGGWERPLAYPLAGETLEEAARREALAVRSGVGIFDGSPLGKIEVFGRDAARFLDRVYVQTISTLEPGKTRYGLMLNEIGTIVDDGVCARLAEDHFLVHTTSGGAGRIADVLDEWLQCEWIDLDVILVDVTAQWANLTLSGPDARTILANLDVDVDVSRDALPHMGFVTCKLGGVSARIFRISYTGEVSFEINVPARHSLELYETVWKRAARRGLTPYGLEALLILRAEKGYLHVGGDTDGTTQPQDVGFGRGAKKASDFIGRRSLTQPEAMGKSRQQLVGLASTDQRVLPIGAHVLSGERPPCESDGFVTYSCMSPSLGRPLALAMVRNGRSRMGETVQVHDLGRSYEATIVDTKAFDPSGERLNG